MTTLDRHGVGLSVPGPALGAGAQIALLALLAAGVGLGAAGWLAGAAYAVTVWAALTAALHRAGARSLGPANRITLARATLAGGVTALVADHLAGRAPGHLGAGGFVAVLVTVAAVALALDAIDGPVARRTGTVSPLGARFDMEVDAFLILVLSAYVAETMGAWVLAIGLMRYAFVAASWRLAWLNAPLPPSRARKTVAALQGIVLAVAAAGVIWHPLVVTSVGLALASLVWSFGRDIGWLWRNRRQAPA